jgi:hypothetical protein
MTRILSPLKLSPFQGLKEPGVIQTLDRERRRKLFPRFAFPPWKEKKFSLLFQLGMRITGKTVTTCIPKSLQIHRVRAFLHDTSLYVTDNLRALRTESATRAALVLALQ